MSESVAPASQESTRPRGEWFCAFYDPSSLGCTTKLTVDELLNSLAKQEDVVQRRVIWQAQSGDSTSSRTDITLKGATFDRCDFPDKLNNIIFENCVFKACWFDARSLDGEKATVQNCKFKNCKFDVCHFGRCRFDRCVFNPFCSFSSNTISATHFEIQHSSLPVSAFIAGLIYQKDAAAMNGLEKYGVPKDQREEHQKTKFHNSLFKITKQLRECSKTVGNTKMYSQSLRAHILAELDWEMERLHFAQRYDPADTWRDRFAPDYDVTKTNAFMRLVVLLVLIPLQHGEYCLAWAAGWLTEWGLSFKRGIGAFIAITFGMAIAYAAVLGIGIGPACWASVEIGLLFGYSNYAVQPWQRGADAFYLLRLLHGIWAVFWYSLVLTQIARKVMD